MSCFENNDIKFKDYCNNCKMFVNFTNTMYDEIINNQNSKEDKIELLECYEVSFLEELFRKSCSRWLENVEDINEKKEIGERMISYDNESELIGQILYDIPLNKDARNLWINKYNGIIYIQFSRLRWFKNFIDNLKEII